MTERNITVGEALRVLIEYFKERYQDAEPRTLAKVSYKDLKVSYKDLLALEHREGDRQADVFRALAAALLVEASTEDAAFHVPSTGRPPIRTEDGEKAYKILVAAGVDFDAVWKDEKDKIDEYIRARPKDRLKLVTLFGQKFERARNVFREEQTYRKNLRKVFACD